ncbi:MAG: proteasome subunit alpha, partial [Candidatus Thermoplasmatota archaeon]|nr:proteasome subunit alpha [Candidatus Thermoplasmatota archaeon]
GAMNYFESHYKDGLNMEEAIDLAIKALYKGTEGKLNPDATEIGVVDKSFKFHILPPSKTKEYVAKAIGGN